MIASPDSSTSATSWTTCSVIWPAGTITQTARGASSFSASSFSEKVGTAPSPASWLVGSGVRL